MPDPADGCRSRVTPVVICGSLVRMEQLQNIRWRVIRPQRLSVRRWDDEVVVYDDGSGDTHIFEDFAGQVLERLLQASADTDELSQLAAESVGKNLADEHCVEQVLGVIGRLRRTGIVQPVRT